MNSRDADDPVAEYHFLRGALRGTQLTLLEARLLHLGIDTTEITALDAIASVRIAFERDLRRIGWGVALGVVALAVFALAAPLDAFVGRGLADVSAQLARDGAQASGLAHFLESALGLLGFAAGLMPMVAFALFASGALLVVRGWSGDTALAVTLPSVEREFRVPGREPLLMDFAENLSQAIASRMRR